jgi:hypothetical protein
MVAMDTKLGLLYNYGELPIADNRILDIVFYSQLNVVVTSEANSLVDQGGLPGHTSPR